MKQKILLLSFLFLSLIGYAQPIDWNKKLPADPNVLIGKLPNGITYYLRHNGEQQLMYPVCYYTKVEHIYFNY